MEWCADEDDDDGDVDLDGGEGEGEDEDGFPRAGSQWTDEAAAKRIARKMVEMVEMVELYIVAEKRGAEIVA